MTEEKKDEVTPFYTGASEPFNPVGVRGVHIGPWGIQPGPLNAGLPPPAVAVTVTAGTLPFMGVG